MVGIQPYHIITNTAVIANAQLVSLASGILLAFVESDCKPLQRQLFQIAAVRRVQRHTGLTHHF